MLGWQINTELPLGLGVSNSAATLRSWASIWMRNYHWDSARLSPTQKSDPVSAYGGRTTNCPRRVGAYLLTWIQSTYHCCQKTLSSVDQRNQKHPLTSMGLQMDTELPLGIGVSEPSEELGSRDSRWMQKCHSASVCCSSLPNMDSGPEYGFRNATGPQTRCLAPNLNTEHRSLVSVDSKH